MYNGDEQNHLKSISSDIENIFKSLRSLSGNALRQS